MAYLKILSTLFLKSAMFRSVVSILHLKDAMLGIKGALFCFKGTLSNLKEAMCGLRKAIFVLRIMRFGLLVCILPFLMACSHQRNGKNSDWTLTQAQRDSIVFSETHHYNVGYNFIITRDSVVLLPSPEGIEFNLDYMQDSAVIHEGEDFVVTEIFKVSAAESAKIDSVWLRVGSDGAPLGWVPERDVLERATPVDPISRFIHLFSGSHLYLFYAIFLIAASVAFFRIRHHKSTFMVHFNDAPSIYPTAFCIAIATAAMLYATIQLFAPDMWVEYYFHPSLNPLGQPFVISLFLVFVWLCIVLLLSVVFDLKDKISISSFASYFAGLLAWGGVLYIVFTMSIEIYVGYIIYIAYVVFALAQYILKNRQRSNSDKE